MAGLPSQYRTPAAEVCPARDGFVSPARLLLPVLVLLASALLLLGADPLACSLFWLIASCLLLAFVLVTLVLQALKRISGHLARCLDELGRSIAAWEVSEAPVPGSPPGSDGGSRLPWGFRRVARSLDRLALSILQARQAFGIIAEHVAVWESWFAPDGRLRWVGGPVQAISGYTRADCLALPGYPHSLIHPEDRPRFGWLSQRAAAGGQECGASLRLLTRTGGVRWVWASWRRVCSENGDDLGLRLSIADTGRMRHAVAPHALGPDVQGRGPLGHWEWSLDEDRLYWSDEVYPIFGVESRTFAVSYPTLLERIFPEDRPRVAAALVAALNGDAPYRVEHRILRPDGSVRHVLQEGHAERDPEGRPLRLYGIVQDITGGRQARQALSRVNRLYAVLCEANRAMVSECELQALFGRICRIIVDRGELPLAWIGMPDAQGECLVPVAVAGIAAGYARDRRFPLAQSGGDCEPVAEVLRCGISQVDQDLDAQGSRQAWQQQAVAWGLRSLVALPLRQDDTVVACLVVYSAQKGYFSADLLQLLEALAANLSFALRAQARAQRGLELEAELQRLQREFEGRVAERTQALQVVNGELEAFSYSVSHDLRAPLRRIDGFSRLLLEQHGGQLSSTGCDYLDRIRRSSERMGQLIDDLLELSQIGRQRLQPTEVCLSTLAVSVIEELQQGEPERALQVHIEPGLRVCADARLMRIVLENLLGNAWKFSAGRTRARVRFGACERDGQRLLYVRDDGAGFDERYVDRLFKPFQRLHPASEFEGTGIGLATVRRIIVRHGGRIWAEGRVGEGATFYFSLQGGCPPSQEVTSER